MTLTKPQPNPVRPITAAKDAEFLRVTRWAEDQILKGTAPSFHKAADEIAMSPDHFRERFKVLTGKTFKRWVSGRQIEHAKDRLLRGLSIACVVSRGGFCNGTHFRERFEQIVGVTVAEWMTANNLGGS